MKPRWKTYPKMKDSGVEWIGEVPEGWEFKLLKQIFENLDSKRIPLSAEQRGFLEKVYPYYGASGIIDYVEEYIFNEPLLLIAEDGANLLSRSTPLAFTAHGKYWVNNHAHILRPKRGNLSFWEYLLSIYDFTPLVSGSAQPKLTAENLGTILLPVPDNSTQIEIAAFLDRETARIDDLIAKKERLIQLLQEKRAALITHAVTKGIQPGVKMKDSGVEWIGEVPEGWVTKKLKAISNFVSGGTPDTNHIEYWIGDIPWVSSKDMKVLRIDDAEDHISINAVKESATTLVPKNTILMVTRSGILRHSIPVAIAKREVAINQDIKGIILKNALHADYVMYLINGSQVQLLSLWKKQGATVESLETDLIKDTIIPLPPLPEQHAIAAFLDRETARIDNLIATIRQAITTLSEYRSALISSAVTGKIDVRGGWIEQGVLIKQKRRK